MSVADLVFGLEPEATSVRRARGKARRWAEGLAPEALDALELVLSELVTNAIRHGSGSVEVELREGPSAIYIGVSDSGAGRPRVEDVPSAAIDGRGLRIVQQLALGWGVIRSGTGGKTVWARLRARPENQRATRRGSTRPIW